MSFVQVIVALLRSIEVGHVISWAFEAHAGTASTALNLITASKSLNQDITG